MKPGEHPLDAVRWVHVDSLRPNDYNPNTVAGPEMRLLERSILDLGWLYPILVADDLTIVDGFHRAALAKSSPKIRKRDGGMVPVVDLPFGRARALVTTVRLNRAKGVHQALRMHALVVELVDVHGWSLAKVGRELGASAKEVRSLYADVVFKARKIEEHRYSKAWYPVPKPPKTEEQPAEPAPAPRAPEPEGRRRTLGSR